MEENLTTSSKSTCNLVKNRTLFRNINSLRLGILRLDLSKNKLDTFPAELGTLTQLRVLILSKNEINYITETLGNLTNLVVLKASNNFLWEIDKSLGQLAQLEVLDIWANRLIDLPGTMDELYNLRYLDMRVNPVKREMQEEIQDYVPECKMHFSYDCKCY